MPVVARGRPSLTTEIPTPAKAGAAVVTLPRCKESRGTATRHQPERHVPVPEVQILSSAVPIAMRKRASKCALEKPLASGPGPIAVTGRRDGAGGSVGIATERTPESGALCMTRASMTSRFVATLGTWWRSTGNTLRSMLPRDCPTAVTSAARLATGRTAAPARSLLQKDWVAQEEAW
jgi:hypothetical protein